MKTPRGAYRVNNGILHSYSKKTRNKSKLNFNFYENYLAPFIGILYLWTNYLRGRGVCYLNFLPLWNIFLFLFLPPKTHLGPITGFVFKKKVTGVNFFLRKYLNNFLFKINLQILLVRQNKTYFSTDLLKLLIANNSQKKMYFNYLINLVEVKKNKIKKNIDFLIYNRNYSVKNNLYRNILLKILSKINLNIYVIGDYLSFAKVKNLGFISRAKTINLLTRTKFVINSGENPYNIFTIDAFNNHANIIYEKRFRNKIKFFNKNKLLFFNSCNKEEIFNFFIKKNNHITQSLLTKECTNTKSKNLNYFNSVKIDYTKI